MTVSDKKLLILIDGSSYLFRAYHALPALTNANGQPTGAVYGVINMIKKLMGTYSSASVAVVFDAKGKTFRHDLYAEYKANRAVMPDELQVQIAPLHKIIRALGLPLIIQPGVEADDLIGTLAKRAEQAGMSTLISTMDKDMAQLVNEKVTLINTMSDRTLDPEGVVEKFGVRPDQIIDYLALIGDTSDNVPGIPKVGPKTAAKWLAQYGSLDEIIKHADEIKGKVGENLRDNLEMLSLAKQLVTIDCDVDFNEDIKTLKQQDPDDNTLKEIFTELEFTSWLKDLSKKHESQATQAAEKNYQCIQDEKAFLDYLKKIEKVSAFALDTETTSLDAMRGGLVGLSLSIKPGEGVYVPLAHQTEESQIDLTWALDKIKPYLQDKQKSIIGQNLKYDYKILKRHHLEITAPMCDTMLESYVLNSTSSRHDMDTLAMKFLGRNTIKFEDVAGKGAKQITFDHVTLPVATDYAAEDADVTLQLHETLWQKVEKTPALKKVLEDIEWPLMPILANMEYTGVLLDTEMLAHQSEHLQTRIDAIQKRAFELAGEAFNIASPKQLQAILFEKLKLPVLKKTPKGAPSTAEEVMQELALDFELPSLIVEFRQLSKLKSTYTDALPKQINPETGRVHTSYNQAVTSTGRLSSNNPNLQNIPVRSEEGRKIRQAFIAPKGYKIVAADYSQVELRIMAHLSKDPSLLKAFEQGLDVHASTASEVFGVSLDEVTSDMRRDAKAINFGLLYGMSAFGLAKQIGTSRDKAQEYMDLYFKRFSKVHDYMESARQYASEHGFVETLTGRRLFVPDINASNHMRKMAAERAAINAPLQGTAADIIKLAMICIDRVFKEKSIDARMIMQVHDELIFEVAEDKVDSITLLIKDCMESAMSLAVPLLVSIGVGDNWGEAH